MSDWTGYNLPITSDDIVFEVGGYEGAWAQYIAETYDPWQYVFEPAPRAYGVAKRRLGKFPKVHLYNFGLGCQDAILPLGDSERDGAGFYTREPPIVKAKVVDTKRFIQDQGIENIEVMRVNIEGGEYEFMPYLIGTGLIRLVRHLFMQWHYIATIPDASPTRIAIDRLLGYTHAAIRPSPQRNWVMWSRKEEDVQRP